MQGFLLVTLHTHVQVMYNVISQYPLIATKTHFLYVRFDVAFAVISYMNCERFAAIVWLESSFQKLNQNIGSAVNMIVFAAVDTSQVSGILTDNISSLRIQLCADLSSCEIVILTHLTMSIKALKSHV